MSKYPLLVEIYLIALSGPQTKELVACLNKALHLSVRLASQYIAWTVVWKVQSFQGDLLQRFQSFDAWRKDGHDYVDEGRNARHPDGQ